MTALRQSIETRDPGRSEPTREGVPTVVPVAFPGRWVGGAVGVIATVVVGVALRIVLLVGDDRERLVDNDLLGAASVVAFLGVPIAFVLGRHLAPVARDGGGRAALSVAVTFALLAPPLGDLEIVAGSGLAPWMAGGDVDVLTAFAGAVFIGGIGVVVSYVALPVTAAVAAVWIVLMRWLPAGLPARLEVPRPIARLGVRHAVLVLGAWLVIAWTVWTVAAPPRVAPWA